MHYRLVLLALAAAVSAQSLSGLPSCATTCVTSDLPSKCNGDPKCICSSPGFITAISCCIYKSCDTTDQQAALAYAKSICTPAGVTNLPTAATCTGGAASATSSGQSSASGSATSASSGAVTSSESTAASSSSESSAATTSAGAVCAGLLALAGML
ncbi:hypothetical protein DV736_g2649, partial [Chaetothyriales sp. CBS 134916]